MNEGQLELGINDPVSHAALEAALDEIKRSPADRGEVKLIVCRPAVNQRRVLEVGNLSPATGLEGDYWATTAVNETGRAFHRDTQINLVNARLMMAVCADKMRWPLAGDQFYVDFDLSESNMPAGTRFSLGSALLEVTAEPHRACAKFAKRFGRDAVRVINASRNAALNLRGINARVLEAGQVGCPDRLEKLV